MLITVEQFNDMPVLSLHTGLEIARLGKPIVDPRKLRIVAFHVTGRRLDDQESVLHPEDIREISDAGIIVDSSDNLMSTNGLVRLQEIIDFEFNPIGVKVEDEQKHKLGTVQSYAIDPSTFFVQQIYARPSFMASLGVTSHTIHRSQVVSITNKKIIVKSPTVAAKTPVEATVRQPFINPFRTSPEPDSRED